MQKENEGIYYDEQDVLIYRAMIELGWIIPTTEQELEWFDEANKDFEPPPFDFEAGLEKLKERIRNGFQNKENNSEIGIAED